MATKDRITIENRLTKVEEGLGSVKKDTSTILINHLPHINKKLNWLFLVVIAMAIGGQLDIFPIVRAFLFG